LGQLYTYSPSDPVTSTSRISTSSQSPTNGQATSTVQPTTVSSTSVSSGVKVGASLGALSLVALVVAYVFIRRRMKQRDVSKSPVSMNALNASSTNLQPMGSTAALVRPRGPRLSRG